MISRFTGDFTGSTLFAHKSLHPNQINQKPQHSSKKVPKSMITADTSIHRQKTTRTSSYLHKTFMKTLFQNDQE